MKSVFSLKPPGWLAGFILVIACTLLIACSNAPIKLDGGLQLPTSHRIVNLPYFPQQQDQCGPASLATMLGARGIVVTAEELRTKVYISAKEGSLTTELVARARRYGLLVYPLTPNMLDVFAEISADNPVLVLQNLGFNWLPLWHFSVVIGYDLQQQTVTLRSGKQRAYEVDVQLFLKTWQRAGNWAVVITEPHQLPFTAQESRLINSANELELVGEKTAALNAYQAMLVRWPASALASFGAGNSAYALEQYSLARSFFSDFIDQQPNSAAGWNNLAYSLLKLGYLDEAAMAMSCAVQLAPDDTSILESYAEISLPSASAAPATSVQLPDCPIAN